MLIKTTAYSFAYFNIKVFRLNPGKIKYSQLNGNLIK